MNTTEILNEILGIEKLRVTDAEVKEEEIILRVETTIEVGICPTCGRLSEKVHDKDEQLIRDLSLGEKRCYLRNEVKRYECEVCRNTFVERVEWRREGSNSTHRYEKYIYERARKEPIRQIAEEEVLSEEAVQGIFEKRAKKRLRHGGTRR